RIRTDRREEHPLSGGLGDLVVPLLVAERSRHAAAPRIEDREFEPFYPREQATRRFHTDDGLLMAVTVDDRSPLQPAGLVVGLIGKKLLEREAVRGESLRARVPREIGDLVAQREDAARLETYHRDALLHERGEYVQ